MSVLSVAWRDILFAHWSVAPESVETHLPDGIGLDAHDGRAWLGVVAFEVADLRLRFAPVGRSFGQVNLRTYVRGPAGPGVYFFSLDADDRLGAAVARRLFRLPYYRADVTVERGDAREPHTSRVTLRSRRVGRGEAPARFGATYGPDPDAEPFVADPGTLANFLVERYRFYATDDAGRLYRGEIDHPPWRLSEACAEVEENSLFRASGLDRPGGEPRLHYCPEMEATAGLVRRCRV